MPDLDQIKQGNRGSGPALTRRAVELALRRPHRDAALPLTDPAALPRTRGEIRIAADRPTEQSPWAEGPTISPRR
jgi:hypothetical protein